MLKNWKITARLASPLIGDPPQMDALLIWEMANRLGMKHARKVGKNTPLRELQGVPIPVSKKTVGGIDIYRVSDPILVNVRKEWVEHFTKRFDSDLLASCIAPGNRKSLLVASGPYKMRFLQERLRLVDSVVWFARCDRKEVRKIIKSIHALGKRRNVGFGIVSEWSFEEQSLDCSLFAKNKHKKVLMKRMPVEGVGDDVSGYRVSFGGAFPPYWHPETFREIAVPC